MFIKRKLTLFFDKKSGQKSGQKKYLVYNNGSCDLFLADASKKQIGVFDTNNILSTVKCRGRKVINSVPIPQIL